MEKVRAVVRAVQMNAQSWAVHCSECGALGLVHGDDTDTPSIAHMKKFHGATVVTR